MASSLRHARNAFRAGLLTSVAASACLTAPGIATAAAGHTLIVGSGSSWAANAVNQWVADVQGQGLQVVYTPNGSAQGRRDFAFKTTDFAVTDLPYQGVDPVSGQTDTSMGRQYAYLPFVGGGLAFPYQLTVNGSLVNDLRLSGASLAGIFTGQIQYWDDPAIAADNNDRIALPHLVITPVVHSEGSAASYHLSAWLSDQFPQQWQAFSQTTGPSQYFPQSPGEVTQNGSDAVMNYVSSAAANGAIGYDEYSYPLSKNYPVAKVENAAGYFTGPTAGNVAVSLSRAVVNEDPTSPGYLTADVRPVYRSADPRTYPLSSYSYLIIPTAADDPKVTSTKRQTLADFATYALCRGQQEMGPIGYAPLPLNLVDNAFTHLQALKAADPLVDLTNHDVNHCANPTFTGNPAADAFDQYPTPAPCDRRGAGPCGVPPDQSVLSQPASASVGYRGPVRLTTTLIDDTTHSVLPGRLITLAARPVGSASFQPIATLTTSPAGVASAIVRPATTTEYLFSYAGDTDHVAASTPVVTIRVGQSVSIHLTRRPAHRVEVWGAVTPQRARGVVRLERRIGARWVVIATGRQIRQRMPGGHVYIGYRFTYTATGTGRIALRVRADRTPSNVASTSRPVVISIGS